MPTFSYVALDSKGNTIKKMVDGPDRSNVIDTLIKQGLRPVSIKEAKAKTTNITFAKFTGSKKVKSDQLVMFTRQLSAMISAGVPILRALML
jgi:type II secretory pathway component PulF